MPIGAGASPEWVESTRNGSLTMSKSNLLSKERAADDRPDRRDPDRDPSGGLPPEPNPEHPSHYRDEARRVFKRWKAGMYESDDLDARQYGLLAYWYPHVAPSPGGESR